MPVVHISYYTDPACPWSWALEPALRKLLSELGDAVQLSYVMSGMAREFGDPLSLIGEMLAAGQGGMPVDARLWLDGRPKSSYPACIAVKAAAEQGHAGPVLRRLREGFMCRRRKLDTTEALIDEARAVPGLDVERFRVDLGSHALLEAFGADLDHAASVPAEHLAEGQRRPELPTLEFRASDGAIHGVYGFADYAELLAAARAAGAESSGVSTPTVEQALGRFPTMATAEVAAVCDLPGPRAPAELWRLALEWRAKAERVGSGELWTVA